MSYGADLMRETGIARPRGVSPHVLCPPIGRPQRDACGHRSLPGILRLAPARAGVRGRLQVRRGGTSFTGQVPQVSWSPPLCPPPLLLQPLQDTRLLTTKEHLTQTVVGHARNPAAVPLHPAPERSERRRHLRRDAAAGEPGWRSPALTLVRHGRALGDGGATGASGLCRVERDFRSEVASLRRRGFDEAGCPASTHPSDAARCLGKRGR